MPKKKMTLDKLAGMMQNEFSSLNKKLDTKVGVKEFRSETKKLKSRIKNVELSNGRIESMLRAEVDRHDDQDLKIKSHEERIIVLEGRDKIKI